MLEFEQEAWEQGYKKVVGVDEVGRGPYAGPVVAAAALLPGGFELEGLTDSKKLTAKKREELAKALHEHPEVKVSIIEISSEEVDKINILEATHKAMREAVKQLMPEADFILVDGKPVKNLPLPSQNIIKGDSRSISIAAASVVAKVYRDNLMVEYSQKYPGYGFEKHMGYGTKAHQEALEKLGPCPIHRRSFAPIAKLLGIEIEKKKPATKAKKKTTTAKPKRKKSKKQVDDSRQLDFGF